jgi:hypothetical protein
MTNLKAGADRAPKTWCCIYYINLNALDDGRSHKVNKYNIIHLMDLLWFLLLYHVYFQPFHNINWSV